MNADLHPSKPAAIAEILDAIADAVIMEIAVEVIAPSTHIMRGLRDAGWTNQ